MNIWQEPKDDFGKGFELVRMVIAGSYFWLVLGLAMMFGQPEMVVKISGIFVLTFGLYELSRLLRLVCYSIKYGI